jgi:uncharacterized protein
MRTTNKPLHWRQKMLIGVVHLKPLPGSPRWKGNFAEVLAAAIADAKAYEDGGAHAVIVENFGDVPFTKGSVWPETIAAMAVAGQAIRGSVGLPMGFNVLRNDGRAALGLASVCGAGFIRINVLTGAMVTDQGVIEGDACHVARERVRLCPDTQIFADVHVKHAAPLGGSSIETAAHDTLDRGLADALIVSGAATGSAANLDDVRRVRQACPKARLLIGSGITAENAAEFLQFADGVIVGSSLKKNGVLSNPVDARRVRTLAAHTR